jgi:hypothetical protein
VVIQRVGQPLTRIGVDGVDAMPAALELLDEQDSRVGDLVLDVKDAKSGHS